MFKNAKIGDRVWSFTDWWGAIEEIDSESRYPIKVDFNNKESCTFTFEGKYKIEDSNPTLFWDEIKYEIPDKPKQRVKKWIVLFWQDIKQEWYISGYHMKPTLYNSLEEAEKDHDAAPYKCIFNEIEIEE